MALTNIGFQKTPGRPIEITFAAETGLPDPTQEVLLIGHAASGTTGINTVVEINNSGDLTAASGEAVAKFGAGSELTKMVIAAVRANTGAPSLPQLKCVPLDSTDTAFGTDDAALTAAGRVKAEYLVSPYDGLDATLRTKLRDTALAMSGAQRVNNNQYGTIGVVFNRSEVDPSLLPAADTQYLMLGWLPDTGAPAYSIAEMAAAIAAKTAGNPVPFNPLDNVTVIGVAAPENMADWITVGAGLESEAALGQGWTPLSVKPNGDVALVRTVTGRLTVDADGVTPVFAYYDVQDFNVLYFLRKALFARFNQPDFRQRKASDDTGKDIKSETIRILTTFQDQNMVQKVSELSKFIQVERNATDRHRFDIKIPTNVIPGLHVIAGNIVATTQFDTVTI